MSVALLAISFARLTTEIFSPMGTSSGHLSTGEAKSNAAQMTLPDDAG